MSMLPWRRRTLVPIADDHRSSCPYPRSVEAIREEEYPLLQGTVYLDHAGTTLYPKSLVEGFATDMKSKLLGNPHSNSPSSMLSTEVIESTRLQALAFFKADPEHFDLVFVANATAAIKLVMDCLSNHSGRAASWYSYHADAHTSLVGIREIIGGSSRCFLSDEEVKKWIRRRHLQKTQGSDLQCHSREETVNLFAYPAQSNMSGRRLPLSWSGSIRSSNTPSSQVYTLLDAAAYVATAQLDLQDANNAPDFVALSFYKTFGFPDLGALIIRKKSSHVLSQRRYFGGGTVDMIINGTESKQYLDAWYAKKSASIHETLEDGTPAVHSILALNVALKTHRRLFGSMENVTKHTCSLIKILHQDMSRLSHANGLPLCKIYQPSPCRYGMSSDQGPTIAFNIRNSGGKWIGKSDFERLAILNNIHLRTGGLCNPGGIAAALEMAPKEMRDNFDEGLRCGNALDEINGKPTGVIRVSLGAMSSMKDISIFMDFMQLFIDTTREKKPNFEPLWESDRKPFIVSAHEKAGSLDSKDVASIIEDSAAGTTCPVAACMKLFKTRESLWGHLAIHKVSKVSTKPSSKTKGCLGMGSRRHRRW